MVAAPDRPDRNGAGASRVSVLVGHRKKHNQCKLQ